MPEFKDIAVFDIGGGYTKVGFAGSNFATDVFPSVVGRPILRMSEKIGDTEIKELMIGQECADNRRLLDVSYPFRNGLVTDWDDYNLLFQHGISKLGINPKESRIVMSEPATASLNSRKKLLELLFEKHQWNAVRLASGAMLSLYAQGLTTGLVLEIGECTMQCLPVVEGYLMRQGIKTAYIGGQAITNTLLTLLGRRGYNFNRSSDFDTVRQIKESFCYIAADPAKEQALAKETVSLDKTYTLPDGRTLCIGSERFEAPEALFKPELASVEAKGAAELYWDSVTSCSRDVRTKLFEQTVLSGGSTMFPGFSTRLRRDVTSIFVREFLHGDQSLMATSKWKLQIDDSPTRKYMVFQGAAVLGELTADPSFVDQWISLADYREFGAELCQPPLLA